MARLTLPPAVPQNDMIWAYNYDTKALTRIATSPYGSEFTSNDYYELGNYAYMTAVVQVGGCLSGFKIDGSGRIAGVVHVVWRPFHAEERCRGMLHAHCLLRIRHSSAVPVPDTQDLQPLPDP
jgi:hypothetical protein